MWECTNEQPISEIAGCNNVLMYQCGNVPINNQSQKARFNNVPIWECNNEQPISEIT